ncbi:MAG TPA: LuxR C-terminal-related transcriptional regulator [Microlunatus sp.]
MTADAEAAHVTGPPTYFTRFVGRDRELAALRARLSAVSTTPNARLTTLVGLGGSGKTRLAVEISTRLLDDPRGRARFPDGLWWVDLATVTDPARVPQTLAAAASLESFTRQSSLDTLARTLRSRRALVVVDNCEHLLPACEALVAGLFSSCPGLTMLATSRTALSGSQEFTVGALDSRTDHPTWRADAVSLFYDRAGTILPGYAAAAHDAPAVTAICERLEGLPLAIELAAPWIRTLSATDLLAQLDRSLEVLDAAAGDGDRLHHDDDAAQTQRHRSLRALLESTWSWLGEDERELLCGLGVFVGGFSRESAEAVAGATVTTLNRLAELSLIRRVPGTGDGTRYVMHELVRQYAVDRMTDRADDEIVGLRRRHLDRCIDLGDRFMEARNSPDETRCLARMLEDHANIESALTWGTRQLESERVLRLVADLPDVWIYTGSPGEHLTEITAALELPWDPESAVAAAARARVTYAAGWATFNLGTEDLGRRFFVEALGLLHTLGDVGEQAACLRALSQIAIVQGDGRTGERLARQSLALCRQIGDDAGAAWSLHHLADAQFSSGRIEESEKTIGAAVMAFRRASVRYGEHGALLDQAKLLRRRRQWSDALHAYADALTILQVTAGFTAGGRDLFLGLGAVADALGRPAEACRLFGAAGTWEKAYGGYDTPIAAPVEEQRVDARTRLGEDAWTAELAVGARWSSEQAVAEASSCVTELLGEPASPLPAGLTLREVEVLKALAEGLSNDDIAERLVISPRTVHAHLRSVFGKLGVSSRTAALREAARLGLELGE